VHVWWKIGQVFLAITWQWKSTTVNSIWCAVTTTQHGTNKILRFFMIFFTITSTSPVKNGWPISILGWNLVFRMKRHTYLIVALQTRALCKICVYILFSWSLIIIIERKDDITLSSIWRLEHSIRGINFFIWLWSMIQHFLRDI